MIKNTILDTDCLYKVIADVVSSVTVTRSEFECMLLRFLFDVGRLFLEKNNANKAYFYFTFIL